MHSVGAPWEMVAGGYNELCGGRLGVRVHRVSSHVAIRCPLKGVLTPPTTSHVRVRLPCAPPSGVKTGVMETLPS